MLVDDGDHPPIDLDDGRVDVGAEIVDQTSCRRSARQVQSVEQPLGVVLVVFRVPRHICAELGFELLQEWVEETLGGLAVTHELVSHLAERGLALVRLGAAEGNDRIAQSSVTRMQCCERVNGGWCCGHRAVGPTPASLEHVGRPYDDRHVGVTLDRILVRVDLVPLE